MMVQYSERFSGLPEYAFPRLRSLLANCEPGGPLLSMSIGEPKHGMPGFAADVVARHSGDFSRYPPNEGLPELRQAIGNWLERRYGVSLDPAREISVLNGSREGLFNAGLALSPETKNGEQPVFLMPNPFYQCYGASALAAGAEPYPVNARAEDGFLPNYRELPKYMLRRVSLCYICSPSNPQGAVADQDYWLDLFALAEEFDFQILADECYSELYRNTPPTGALEAARKHGLDPERVLSFQSLSKRSSAPGLRSGFVAGGPQSVAAITKLRSYGGAPVPLPLQRASQALWDDEGHVAQNRALYRRKLEIADSILGDLPGYVSPEGGFFLWLKTADGEAATLDLYRKTGVRVLPGAYLARAVNGTNPGADYIRVALVADIAEVEHGLTQIRAVLAEHNSQKGAH